MSIPLNSIIDGNLDILAGSTVLNGQGDLTVTGKVNVNGIGNGTPSSTGSTLNLAGTFNDSATPASNTTSTMNFNTFNIPTLTATNTGVTTTTASTVYIAGPPVAGTNETITKGFALNVASGDTGLGNVVIHSDGDISGIGSINGVYPILTAMYTGSTFITTITSGSYVGFIKNRVKNGSSSIMLFCKGLVTNAGNNVRLITAPGIIDGNVLNSVWNSYEGVEVSVNSSFGNGDYTYNLIVKPVIFNTISLSGTAFTMINSATTGTFMYSVYPNTGTTGVSAIFFASKNIAGNSANITRVTSSPDSGCNLNLQWNPNSSLNIQKTASIYDGNYIVYNVMTNCKTSTLTLSGTSYSTFDNSDILYEGKTYIIIIQSTVANGPYAIFTFSKNFCSNYIGKNRFVSNPGMTSNEQLDIIWNPFSFIQIGKNGLNYDGIYNLFYIHL